MAFVCSFWGAVLWLLLGGISGWIIYALINGPKIRELRNSISDRDNRLMAISRDHKSIIAKVEKSNMVLKDNIAHLKKSNKEITVHNNDLRNTISELRQSQEDQLSLLFEPQTAENLKSTVASNSQISPSSTKKDKSSKKSKLITAKSKSKLKKAERKLKEIQKQNLILKKQLTKLKRSAKKNSKLKTITKEVPITIRKEVQIIERIDQKKIKKIFGFKAPVVTSKKTLKISKKKGKPVIVSS